MPFMFMIAVPDGLTCPLKYGTSYKQLNTHIISKILVKYWCAPWEHTSRYSIWFVCQIFSKFDYNYTLRWYLDVNEMWKKERFYFLSFRFIFKNCEKLIKFRLHSFNLFCRDMTRKYQTQNIFHCYETAGVRLPNQWLRKRLFFEWTLFKDSAILYWTIQNSTILKQQLSYLLPFS